METISDVLIQLLSCKEVTCYIPLTIIDIKEIEYKEFSLTLKSKDSKVLEGIFTKTDKTLKKGQIIKYCELSLFNIDSIVKTYINDTIFNKTELNTEDDISNSIVYNLKPENLINFFSSLSTPIKKYQENLFIVKKIDKNLIQLFCLNNSDIYNLDLLFVNHIHDIKEKDFIYCRNHLVKDKKIICDNLTIIKKPSDFELFHLTEIELVNNKEIYEFPIIDEIKSNKCTKSKNKYNMEEKKMNLILKVVLKDKEKNMILLINFNS